MHDTRELFWPAGNFRPQAKQNKNLSGFFIILLQSQQMLNVKLMYFASCDTDSLSHAILYEGRKFGAKYIRFDLRHQHEFILSVCELI